MPITVSGTSIVFNDSTTQTTAFTSAVTSLNGQTGAITNTSVDAIGSYIVALPGVTAPYPGSGPSSQYGLTNYVVNDTIAGSSLRYNVTKDWVVGLSYRLGFQNTVSRVVGGGSRQSLSYTFGGTALSGTWRCMSPTEIFSQFNPCDGTTGADWLNGLWVRIS